MHQSSKTGRMYHSIEAIKDKPDARDFKFTASPSVVVDDAVTLYDQLGPVKDQGQEGSCTAHAGSSHIEANEFHQFKKRIVLSRQFLYYKEREMEGTLPQDAGAESRSIFRVLNKFGIPLESEDPYNTTLMNIPPTDAQLAAAVVRKIDAYHRLETLGDIISCIASGWTCTVAVGLYETFEEDSTLETGVVPLPKKITEREIGGHEMLLWGYDKTGDAIWNAFKVPGVMFRNSWGVTFGKGGNGILPFSYFQDTDLWFDSWMGHFGKWS